MALTKAEYLGYRERARELYETPKLTVGEVLAVASRITIPLHAPVQGCEGGAFVEAVVWIPEEELKKCTS